ncbi:hypothetical protein MPSEU_000154600 [Mayamaea pseudoterrestris]|nr:hypothetical protein MPSEU_000154600 [Mayamaea pseudoterrestris]
MRSNRSKIAAATTNSNNQQHHNRPTSLQQQTQTSSSTPNPNASIHSERKHIIQDFQNPLELLAMAVSIDERRNEEWLLDSPLENVRLHDSTEFSSALAYLQRRCKSLKLRHNEPDADAADKNPFDEKSSIALTPIVLSGLLTAIQHQHSETTTNSTNDANSLHDLGSELVAACQAMRHQALMRVQKYHRRRRFAFASLPLIILAASIATYLQYVWRLQHLFDVLHYTRSCEGASAYGAACRFSDAALWNSLQDCMRDTSNGAWTMNASVHHYLQLPSLNNEVMTSSAPLAMHTMLVQSMVALDDLQAWLSTSQSTSLKPVVDREAIMIDNNATQSLRWLGETTVTRLVGKALRNHVPSSANRLSILDVGCGVGGLLYTLLPSNYSSFSHHGITISGAEVFLARHFANESGVDMTNVTFEQRSFDAPLSSSAYNAVVAIESLTFSRSIDNTLKNLMQTLIPGGVLIMLNDVALVAPTVFGQSKVMQRDNLLPSLVSHSAWKESLTRNNCTMQSARDLSLEYELAGLTSMQPSRKRQPWRQRNVAKAGQRLLNRAMWLASVYSGTNSRIRALDQDLATLAKQQARRRVEYWKVNRAYHMMVCTKH